MLKLLNQSNQKVIKRTDIISEHREIGFVAQEINALLSLDMPNLVKEIPDDTLGNIYAVDYGRLTTLLWGTCRNLLSRVEQLETALINK